MPIKEDGTSRAKSASVGRVFNDGLSSRRDMTDRVEAVVIGAGVVGLACARRLAIAGLETIVLESEMHYGQGISSRNSEVIHAGLYYPAGSLKALLCRAGRESLYAYCEQHGVPHRQSGKWIVATTQSQMATLDQIAARASANGCREVFFLDGSQARRIEPQLCAERVLVSPRTGIIDSHALMTSLLGDLESAGGVLALGAPVTSGELRTDDILLHVGGDAPMSLTARYVINSAGLNAPEVAESMVGFPVTLVPTRCFAKGSYFSLRGKSPFSRLVYPVPEVGGLGAHLTLDLQGAARFGPDVEWVDRPDYSVDAERVEKFCEAIRKYWPECDATRLFPGYAGIRPKLGTPDCFHDDFVIQGAAEHGQTGLVNLFGIESPGLTACLTIAETVAQRLGLA